MMTQRSQQMQLGSSQEKVALAALRKQYDIEDRSAWAKDPNKPYAMDWYWPDQKMAADFKFKKISKSKKYPPAFYLNLEHYQKYCHYVASDPDVEVGVLWYMDQDLGNEYLLELEKLTTGIHVGQVYKGFNEKFRSAYESGYYFRIPLTLFTDITGLSCSINFNRQ